MGRRCRVGGVSVGDQPLCGRCPVERYLRDHVHRHEGAPVGPFWRSGWPGVALDVACHHRAGDRSVDAAGLAHPQRSSPCLSECLRQRRKPQRFHREDACRCAGLGQTAAAICHWKWVGGSRDDIPGSDRCLVVPVVCGFEPRSIGVTLYLTFFLLRDGRSLAEKIATTVPLDRELYDALSGRFIQVIRAMIKGSLVVAVAQGLIGGVVFALLGIPGAALWGTLMGAMSLIPAVGTGIVWVPVALYLLFTGSITEGLILIACGALIISTVDNVLRPILVGRETKMPDPLILISTLGGIAVAGFNGLIIGPVIAALFITVWSMAGKAVDHVRRNESP
ncbi:MAG: hypothetical protein B7Z20_00690 [Sphingobium sp. 32-64-5]|nr:MAG: hypothetical protein B7Z20_00690 [Sphingobium sp. 32-64-5]